jgi:hypothetical protein
MKKYHSIFKETTQLRESEGKWEEFLNIMKTLQDSGSEVFINTQSNQDFYIKLNNAKVESATSEQVTISHNRYSLIIIQKRNFDFFEKRITANLVNVFCKNNSMFSIDWR